MTAPSPEVCFFFTLKLFSNELPTSHDHQPFFFLATTTTTTQPQNEPNRSFSGLPRLSGRHHLWIPTSHHDHPTSKTSASLVFGVVTFLWSPPPSTSFWLPPPAATPSSPPKTSTRFWGLIRILCVNKLYNIT